MEDVRKAKEEEPGNLITPGLLRLGDRFIRS
jgi:hypothetical protein